MPIHALIGKPGAGKSFNGVQRVKEALEGGRGVVTNLPLNLENDYYDKYVDNGQLVLYPASKKVKDGDDSPHFGIIEGWRELMDGEDWVVREIEQPDGSIHKSGPLVIVDEAKSTLETMIRASKKPPHDFAKLQVFFREHRHALVDIYLVYHDHTHIDNETKGLVERFHNVVNASEILGFNAYKVKTSTKGFVSGNNYLNIETHKFKPEIFALYDSYSEGAGKGMKGKKSEIGVKRSKPIWLRKSGLFFIASVILLPIAGYKAYAKMKSVMSGGAAIDMTVPESQIVTEQLNQFVQPSAVRITRDFGPEMPIEAAILVGFDNRFIYLQDGVYISRDYDLKPNGWRVIEAKPCLVTITRDMTVNGQPKTIIKNYRCERGY